MATKRVLLITILWVPWKTTAPEVTWFCLSTHSQSICDLGHINSRQQAYLLGCVPGIIYSKKYMDYPSLHTNRTMEMGCPDAS